MPILHIDRLRFAYPDGPTLIADWSADVPAGVTLLHGDTGSGKSTVVRVLAGALQATGQLRLGEVSLGAAPRAYRARVFCCDPATDRFHALTPAECKAALHAGDTAADEALWQALVEGFGLAPHRDKKLFMLSTGSRRKVYLAAALSASHPLVLLDEPTGALDAASVRCLTAALAAAPRRQPHRAIVVASSGALAGVPLVARFDLPLA